MVGMEVVRSCHHLTAVGYSSRSDVIRNAFSLLMSPSFVCGIGPTAVREKARLPQGRGLKASFRRTLPPVLYKHSKGR